MSRQFSISTPRLTDNSLMASLQVSILRQYSNEASNHSASRNVILRQSSHSYIYLDYYLEGEGGGGGGGGEVGR